MQKKKSARSAAVLTALILGAALTVAQPPPAFAQEVHEFRIDGGDPAKAVQEFGAQSRTQILASATALQGRSLNAVSGSLSTDQALAQMLNGTGLGYRYVDERTIAVVPTGTSRLGSSASEASTTNSPPLPNTDNKPTERKDESSYRFRLAQEASGKPSSATAAEAPIEQGRSSKPAEIQEIVVTAQKRTESLSKTPVAVTAVDMTELQEAGVVGVKDLTSVVPDLQIHTIGVDGFVGITIRGISNLDYSGSANPAVSTYIDGTYIGLSQGLGNQLYDIERVEILRGPQGTLYGRNATGGNVNIITGEPKKTFGAYADVSFGNYNDVQTHGTLNLPLSDQLSVRVAFATHRNDGYFDTERTTGRNYGASDDFAGRLTALWIPSDHFKWRLSVDEAVSRGTPWATIETGIDGKPADGLSPYHQPTASDPEPENDLRNFSVRSRADWSPVDAIDIAYVAGYQKLYQDRLYWASAGQPGSPANPGWQTFYSYPATFETQEVDINYESKRLKNVLGASYFSQLQPNGAQAGITNNLAYSYVEPYSDLESHRNAWGVFDQASYSLMDRLRVTGGLRYSNEDQLVAPITNDICPIFPNLTVHSLYVTNGLAAGCSPFPTAGSGGSWSSTTWKAGIDGDLSDGTLAYLSATSGFKSGGVQPGLPSPLPSTYSPEKVTNYEAGLKTRLLSNSLSFRVAAFYEDYRDLQVFQLVPIPVLGVQLVTLNAAKAAIYGTELESEWRFSEADRIQWFANYLSATYTQFDNAYDSRTGSTVPSLKRNHLPNSPQVQARVQYAHDFRLRNGGAITPLAAVYWQSTSFLQAINSSYYRQGPYSKTNLSLTYSDAGAHWRVAAFIDNLEGTAVRTSSWADGTGGVYSDFAPPRIFGVRVSFEE